MDHLQKISPDEFNIYVDLLGNGEKQELGVVPGDLDEITYMVYLDWAELTCLRYENADDERWVQLEGFNMPQETVDLIGNAIENHYK